MVDVRMQHHQILISLLGQSRIPKFQSHCQCRLAREEGQTAELTTLQVRQRIGRRWPQKGVLVGQAGRRRSCVQGLQTTKRKKRESAGSWANLEDSFFL